VYGKKRCNFRLVADAGGFAVLKKNKYMNKLKKKISTHLHAIASFLEQGNPAIAGRKPITALNCT